MLLLVTDTSGKQGSLALARVDVRNLELLDVAPLTGGAFSAQLVPEIAHILKRCGIAKSELDGLVVVSGPGSFTGLRVGLAAIKGLAEVLKKPIAPVSLLEAVALAACSQGLVVAALDAGRSQAFVALCNVRDHCGAITEFLLLDRDGLRNLVKRQTPSCVAASDDLILDWLRDADVPLRLVERPRADAVAQIGFAKIVAGEVVSPEQLEANYIRRPDAEIFASGSSGSERPAR
jgi:tRNA threonylcarbamoyladenosine biosynthesis protein TsaB